MARSFDECSEIQGTNYNSALKSIYIISFFFFQVYKIFVDLEKPLKKSEVSKYKMEDKMSRENPTVSEIVDALEGKGGPGNGEYYNDVLSNASSKNCAEARKRLDESEGSNR